MATNSQSITRFDCCAAARLLNRPNIQEYWWIQEATGDVWIGLEQNVIDAAINEWRKCLRAELMFVGVLTITRTCLQFWANGFMNMLSWGCWADLKLADFNRLAMLLLFVWILYYIRLSFQWQFIIVC